MELISHVSNSPIKKTHFSVRKCQRWNNVKVLFEILVYTRKEQVDIFRLRTGHNRLNSHMNKKMKKVSSPLCPCGEAEQDSRHVLQDCRQQHRERKELWPTATSLHEKLYGPVEMLQRTALFLTRTGLQV